MLPVSKKRLAGNAGSAILQVVISGLALFLLYRYLLKQLGPEVLGVWSIVVASTSMARLTDFGLTGGVTKFVANFRATGDTVAASNMIQTAAISIAVVVGALIFLAMPLLERVLQWAVPLRQQGLAQSLLPWTLASLWLNCIAGVFLAGLDGCQRATHRNAVMIAGQLVFFALAIWTVKSYGLRGVAISQVAQALLMLASSWMLLRRRLRSLPYMPVRWSGDSFRTSFAYAANFQVITLCVLLFDPITKLLLGRFGGLSMTAYYDMANQLVLKMRALMVSANQVMIPVIAEMDAGSSAKLRFLYARSYAVVFVVALLAYTGLALFLPVISQLWIGNYNAPFLIFGYTLLGAYFVNNLAVPAYFDNLGTGDIRSNVRAHIAMAICNALGGLLFGLWLGGYGVALAVAGSLVLGSLMMLVAAHRKYQVVNLVPPNLRFFASAVVGGTAVGLVILEIGRRRGLSLVGMSAFEVVMFLTAVLLGLRSRQSLRDLLGVSRLVSKESHE